ncbi:hypothetical protein F4677DRAFT_447732 [Hypoxylon crocopeplum]|nr:hypothetical protein F4677DRAFT_447732 [Hypoxylon crocopeplum]
MWAEALGIVTGVAATLEQSLRLFHWIRSALKNRKEVHQLLSRHSDEVSRINELVTSIDAEEALKTRAVRTIVLDLDQHGRELSDHLSSMKRKLERNKFEQIRHALLTGLDDKNDLQKIMNDLERTKANLISHIVLRDIHLVQGIGDSIKVNTIALERLDTSIKAKLDTNDAVKALVQHGNTLDEFSIMSTSKDLSNLSIGNPTGITVKGATSVGQEVVRTPPNNCIFVNRAASMDRDAMERPKRIIIKNNKSSDKAFQVNNPTSKEDIWKHINELNIEGNICSGQATMCNYPMESDVFLKFVGMRMNQSRKRKRSRDNEASDDDQSSATDSYSSEASSKGGRRHKKRPTTRRKQIPTSRSSGYSQE